MLTIIDFVTAMHDIDVIKGRTCGNCLFGDAGPYNEGLGCSAGRSPASREDGCDAFRKLPDVGGRIRLKATQRALDEAGGV